LGPNQSVDLPAGTVHRVANPGPGPLKVIEVATGDYLGEDDVVRIGDDFARDTE
jgi:mannose-6-phosphate isomerase-like protein (cupin superfamily)